MASETVREGYITVAAFPVEPTHTGYRIRSRDFDLKIYLNRWTGDENDLLIRYFNAVQIRNLNKDFNHDDFVFTPCVIGRKTNPKMECYEGDLLVPRGAGKSSGKLARGMIVPELMIEERKTRKVRTTGFILSSEFSDQKYFAPPMVTLRDLDNEINVSMHGKIINVPEETYKNPVVEIVRNSKDSPEVFRQNLEMLKRISRSEERFWWDLNI